MTTTSSATNTPTSAVITSTAPTTSTASSAASAVTTNSIDVATIVAQLMQVENQPLDALKSKINTQQTVISDLGSMKSNVLALQSALTTFESPSTYNNPSANSSDSSVITATSTSNAAIGSVSVTVSQLAAAAKFTVTKTPTSNYTSATDTVSLDPTTGFQLTVGGKIYSTKDANNPINTANGVSTLTDLNNWVNSLGANVKASIVQTTSSSNYVLQIAATQTGLANAVTPGALTQFQALTQGQHVTLGGLTFTAGANGATASQVANAFANITGGTSYTTINSNKALGDVMGGTFTSGTLSPTVNTWPVTGSNGDSVSLYSNQTSQTSIVNAQDAQATIGGLAISRSTNSVNDVVPGITFNLTGVSTTNNGVPVNTTVTISQGADNSSVMINALIAAYNTVVNQYNSLTANSNSGSSTASVNGDLANDPTMLAFVNNIKSMFSFGATDASSVQITASGSDPSATPLSLDMTNGYLQVGSSKFMFSRIPNIASGSTPTISQFTSWVNNLGAGLTATVSNSKDSGGNLQQQISIAGSQIDSGVPIDLSGMSSTVSRNTTSLAAMGMDLQLDGTLQFNTTTYQSAVSGSPSLITKLAQGLKLGYSNSGSNLDAFLKSEVDPSSGALISEITAQQTQVTQMQNQETDLQARLVNIQQSYVSQYSALNALLFQLNSTSTSLASSLAAVTNINAGK